MGNNVVGGTSKRRRLKQKRSSKSCCSGESTTNSLTDEEDIEARIEQRRKLRWELMNNTKVVNITMLGTGGVGKSKYL
jgi:hypothetical protein